MPTIPQGTTPRRRGCPYSLSLIHISKGTWAGKPFELIDWQERIIRDLFGVVKENGYRQFNTCLLYTSRCV